MYPSLGLKSSQLKLCLLLSGAAIKRAKSMKDACSGWKQAVVKIAKGWICRVTPFMHCKQTGWSFQCSIHALVSPPNYNSSHQVFIFSRAVRLWNRGRCNIEGQPVCTLNLISPTLRSASSRSLLIGECLGLTEEEQRTGESRAEQKPFLDQDLWLDQVIIISFKQEKMGWLIRPSKEEPVMQYSYTQTQIRL